MVRKVMFIKISEIQEVIGQCEHCKERFHFTLDALPPWTDMDRRDHGRRQCPFCRSILNKDQHDLIEALRQVSVDKEGDLEICFTIKKDEE